METTDQIAREAVGLLGGSFNPVHIGHLVIAQDALELFGLRRVIFVPNHCPPHKPATELASGVHRLAMLRAATAGDPRFEVSSCELERGGTSYSVDTVKELRGAAPSADYHFIIGTDSLRELHLWKDVYALLSLCTVVTLARPGVDAEAAAGGQTALRTPWPQRLLANVRTAHRMDVSSSDIRQRVAAGRSVRYLVPAGVEEYIVRQGLYTTRKQHEVT